MQTGAGERSLAPPLPMAPPPAKQTIAWVESLIEKVSNCKYR
jgi:hypothetical protein